MRRCNLCTLASIRRNAADGAVTVKADATRIKGFAEAVSVYVNSKWVAYFAELPLQCSCDE